jgi:ABC-type transport system substrate-binding protein
MREFDPTNQIVLEKNPNFRLQRYPDLPRPTGDDPQAMEWYRKTKEERLPMVDRIVWRIEKESIPRWNKFLQGYYDDSGVHSDFFDQTVRLSSRGDSVLTDELSELDVRLVTSQKAGFHFFPFNMNDPVIGKAAGEAGRKIRHAISIAFDTEERISVFESGRAVPSHGPIPPGIFGSEPGQVGINPVVYRWDDEGNRPVRRSLDEARKLLAEAGYRNGYGKDGKPLTIQFVTSWGSAEGRSRVRFVRKQFEKLNIRLIVKPKDANRFQESVRSGSFQFVRWGWQGDYPDPENFLFLFYAPDPSDPDGRTIPKYHSEEYNRLFRKMASMENSPERLVIIRKMLKILRYDAPAIFASHPVGYALYHHWYRGVRANAMALNALKYHHIDPAQRAAYIKEHNTPRAWPIVALLALLGVSAIPAFRIAAKRLREV